MRRSIVNALKRLVNKVFVNLFDYRHDRSITMDRSCKSLKDFVDCFVEQKSLDGWFRSFEYKLGVPEKIIKQYSKAYLANSFDYYQRREFSANFRISALPKEVFRYLGMLVYFLKNRQVKRSDSREVDLVIDLIEFDGELSRFSRLIELFGSDRCLAVVPGKQRLKSDDLEILYRPYYLDYRIDAGFIRYALMWMPMHVVTSMRIGVNLFPLVSSIINSYLYNRTLFELVRGRYCLQMKHYQTNAIKNYMFTSVGGGIASATIQKNIHQTGHNGFYFDTDIFFSMGNVTADSAFELGARIDKVDSVGSLNMEKYWFEELGNVRDLNKKYQLVYMGGNGLFEGSVHDSYDSFRDDYLEQFSWLVRLAEERSGWIIGIKHHSNHVVDKEEQEIIINSNVSYLDPLKNSYQMAFQSCCIATFASTMALEMIAHGVPALFLDPMNRNKQFVPDGGTYRMWKAVSYEEFRGKVESFVDKENNYMTEKFDDLCLDSRDVSSRIYNGLHQYCSNA